MWLPEGGQGPNLAFAPHVVGAPFPFFNPAPPVNGVVPASPGKLLSGAGGQAAGTEEAKGQEVRKEEEGGQPAAAAAPAAVAWPQGSGGSKVRPPVRLPGESGDTPEPKAARSDEQEGAAASEEGAAGLAPVRLGWSTVAPRAGRYRRAGVRLGVGSKLPRHYAK